MYIFLQYANQRTDMKYIICALCFLFFTNSTFAECYVSGAGCYANPENCSGSSCSTTYYYDKGTCSCTDYCVCESPPPGFEIDECFCPAEPGGQAVACS